MFLLTGKVGVMERMEHERFSLKTGATEQERIICVRVGETVKQNRATRVTE